MILFELNDSNPEDLSDVYLDVKKIDEVCAKFLTIRKIANTGENIDCLGHINEQELFEFAINDLIQEQMDFYFESSISSLNQLL